MNRLTSIDLTAMSAESRILYLQDLLFDAVDIIKDITNNEYNQPYLKDFINHATQASLDIQQLTKKGI